MYKPFNLEEAQQGKPYTYHGTYYQKPPLYSYIGMTKDGKIVSENEYGVVITLSPKEMEMITIKKTYYANLYFRDDQPSIGLKYSRYEDAVDHINNYDQFIKTITFEVEE